MSRREGGGREDSLVGRGRWAGGQKGKGWWVSGRKSLMGSGRWAGGGKGKAAGGRRNYDRRRGKGLLYEVENVEASLIVPVVLFSLIYCNENQIHE
jgi:hypothetical protein